MFFQPVLFIVNISLFSSDGLLMELSPYFKNCFLHSQAALLGSGASLLSVSSDIGGSSRLPALFCGVFGHKPTPGKSYRKKYKVQKTMIFWSKEKKLPKKSKTLNFYAFFCCKVTRHSCAPSKHVVVLCIA